MLAPMKQRDRERLAEALRFALEAHGEQTRKGREIPYASHLLQVSGLVLEHGGDATLAMAGVLHDALEDTEHVDGAELRARFGDEVARIVENCTDLLPGDRPDARSSWELRKRGYLERLRAADARTRLVVVCDKVHNLRSLVADLRAEGVETLTRFTATPAQTRWYFESVRETLCDGLPSRLVDELDGLLVVLRGFVPLPDLRAR
jgi:(p)ppGpp synthase/HD superfamily hydrolase